jgi:HEAT repeat protein
MMSLVGPSGATAIREVRPNGPNAVRIVVEQVGEREITGNPEDETIRRLLLAGMSDPLDPGVRIDAVQSLAGQPGNDVKQALLHSVRNDPNAAVRLKALDALGRFAPDTETQDTLKYVLQHDDDAAVRSEAIDLLAPVNHPLTPEMAATLESVLRSGQQDDYVHARCVQILREFGLSPDLY